MVLIFLVEWVDFKVKIKFPDKIVLVRVNGGSSKQIYSLPEAPETSYQDKWDCVHCSIGLFHVYWII